MAFEVRIPTLGESVTEGTIVRWAKRDGEAVKTDDVLLELETDKASMEIAAERPGTLRIVKKEGETVAVGDVVARIEEGAGAEAARPAAAPASAPAAAKTTLVDDGGVARPNLEAASEQETVAAEDGDEASHAVGPLSPAVRRLLTEHGIDPATVPSSGKGGRLTKEDVLAYLERSGVVPVRPAEPAPAPAAAQPAPPPTPAAAPAASAPTPSPAPPRPALAVTEAKPKPSPPTPIRPLTPAPRPGTDVEEAVPMGRIRKRIAERLVQAQRTAAILTTFNEIDMTAVMALRATHKERFQKVHGVSLGFMSFFARACVAALREIPVVNAEIRGDDVVYKHYVSLGVAVGTERGLVVPVVHHAERLSFAEIEREIGRLAELARDGKLSLDDLSGGTFTISNGGVYGSLFSTPILNPPQSAILGMHKIEKRPVVVGDDIAIRPMMYVALSYDHRLIDGEQAVTFLVRVKERLENPERLLLEV
jgi:2-oxoglutarate dehydrogenase E2 component (dihydrolipoamide succinyltransferase)